MENDEESEEVYEEDFLEARPPLLSSELRLNLDDLEITAEIAELDAFRSDNE
jgi:hypothetical protein